MADERPLHERLIELAVFVPVGVASSLVEDLPTLAEKGRERFDKEVQLARTMGKLAVKQARRRIERLSGAAVPPAATGTTAPSSSAGGDSGRSSSAGGGSAPSSSAGGGSGRSSSAKAGSGQQAGRSATPSPEPGAPGSEATPRRSPTTPTGPSAPASRLGDVLPDVGSLAIPAYDTLAASQVVQRLSSLRPDELAAVGAYEQATRGRRTILHRIAQLSSGPGRATA